MKKKRKLNFGEIVRVSKTKFRLGVKRGSTTSTVTAKKKKQSERGKAMDKRSRSKTRITAKQSRRFAHVGDTKTQQQEHGRRK